MKKAATLALVMVLSFTMVISAAAKSENSKGNPKDTTVKANNGITHTQKVYKAELDAQKKAAIQERNVLNKEKGILEAEYDELVALGDTEGAELKLAEINALNDEIKQCQIKIKEAIDERYMLIKTMYTEDELIAFENAGAAIDAMYADAATYVLKAGCIMANDELIKFDTPPYIKGGVTLVPVRAITEQLGAQVVWDGETQTVSITKDGITITMMIGSNYVTVTGPDAVADPDATADPDAAATQIDIDVAAEITNGRTYVPLRFLAETLEFAVTWNGDDMTIDINDQAVDEAESTVEPDATPAV